MYIQEYKRKKGNKEYKSVYLAESYRENGKVKKKYISNLSNCPDNIILAIKNELKKPTEATNDNISKIIFEQGKSFGGISAIVQICKRLGIENALGEDVRQSGLALFQIAGRVLVQRSRNYIANDWAPTVAVEEVLGLDSFNENTLYDNLDWLCENQEKIEKKLFRFRHRNEPVKTVYLYDVTSSYFEGTENELATFGYNRDKKKGKKQIVIGLLCDKKGYPISVQVFKGNRTDSTTVSDQLKKLQKTFGIEHVIMVGDRGMIKSAAIAEMTTLKWHYLTAITKPQIKQLLAQNMLQLSLFQEKLIEVEVAGIRYILRRNPLRKLENEKYRNSKIVKVQQLATLKNTYLASHPRASENKALEAVLNNAKKLKVNTILEITIENRNITVQELPEIKAELEILDGCYVLKSNVPQSVATKEELNKQYKELALVETAFRTMKQSFEEMQPIYLRNADRTRGHVFVCMLGYIVMKYIWDECECLSIQQAAIYQNLNDIHYFKYKFESKEIKKLPDVFTETQTKIVKQLKIKIPAYL